MATSGSTPISPAWSLPEWEDIRPIGTQVTLGDDNGVVVDLPFDFPFYGQNKSQIAIWFQRVSDLWKAASVCGLTPISRVP